MRGAPKLSPTLASLALSPAEVARLRGKGVIGGGGQTTALDKSVHQLVRLSHPLAGWTVLIGLIEVTPALATRWLQNNFGNRPVSDDTVAAYARDALNGNFITTHQGIAFADDDKLIDGQHRLRGIQRSGTPCILLVSFGWPAKVKGKEMTTMDAVDRGRPRTVADQLKIQHGFADAGITASVCAQLGGLCFGERTRRLSVGQTLGVFRAFEASVLWAVAQSSKQPGFRAAGVLAGFAFAHAVSPEAVHPLFRVFNSGEGIERHPVLGALREFLGSEAATLLSRGHDRGLAETCLQALWMELEKKPGKLACVPDGANWFRVRQPERVEKIAAMFRLNESR